MRERLVTAAGAAQAMNKSHMNSSGQSGFSLMELVVGMSITLVIMTIASTLLASSFAIRGRENQRSAAIADAQRALNTMSREIANAGYGLSTNGIVAGDSGLNQIRVRSDLDLSGATGASGEDIKYVLINDANGSFIVRMDLQPSQTTGLIANRIDGMKIRYYDQRVTYTIGDCTTGVANCDISNVLNSAGNATAEVTPDLAKYIVVIVNVTLPAVGTVGSPGYQAPSATQLVSTVTLRNASLQYY
jgi:prepilin-type N-terminal cleavage/methylation domain-containing protein